jgi:hypothetical protein
MITIEDVVYVRYAVPDLDAAGMSDRELREGTTWQRT